MGTWAAAERSARRAAYPPGALAVAGPRPHVVLLQLESFWDPRGTLPQAPPDLLPHWDRLGEFALARGRLAVPGFGANTMRAEFAALTGIGQQAPEIDRALAVYVPGADPSALDAAATIVAKMSIGSGTVRDTHMVSAMPHEESGNLLAVGAYAALPPELLDAVRVRSGSDEPSPADEPVPRTSTRQ